MRWLRLHLLHAHAVCAAHMHVAHTHAAAHASQLDKQLTAAEDALQAEQVVLSRLQADLTLERSEAAARKVDWC
jgi:hypothetical protein